VRHVVAVPSPQDALAKWKTRASAAAGDYVAGVQNTDKDIANLAIQAIPRMRTEIIAAIDSGRVANGLRRIGTAGIKQAVQEKGGAAYSNGVQNADTKFLDAFGRLLPYIQQAQTQVASMPNLTDADRDQRMLRFVQLMRQYKSG
jgi:hypothetical protein